MAYTMQPIYQKDYQINIITDLGMIAHTNKSRKHHYIIAECSTCLKHFTLRVCSSKSRAQTQCIDCSIATHHLSKHPLYAVWNGIRQRCYSSSRKDYSRYGGIGVVMCDEWKDSPTEFIVWCVNNGWSKGLEVDKDIKSTLLNIVPAIYSPDTISFVTSQENSEAACGKEVLQYALDGVFIASHVSTTAAIKSLGKESTARSSIANCCRGVSKSSFGYIWKYKI